MAGYGRWIVEEEGGDLVVRLEPARGIVLNAVAGAAVTAGGLWLQSRPESGGVGSGVMLVGLFWLLMAALAWIGDRQLRITAEELIWERTPGGSDRYPRDAVRGVRIVGMAGGGGRLRTPALPWRVELEPRESGTVLPMSFRFGDEEAARRLARRLSSRLSVPLLRTPEDGAN